MTPRQTNGGAEIVPSILSADFTRLGGQIDDLKTAGCRMLHIDVMDGHFVPNITIGLPVVASLRRSTDLLLDCHLMIENPDQYVERFVEAGADMVSVHQEAAPHLDRTLTTIRAAGAKAGVAINPATPVNTLSEVLGLADYILVMSVNPGFSGQKFISHALDKISQLKELRENTRAGFQIQIDGGVGPKNIEDVVRAGTDLAVAASAIFGASKPQENFTELQRAASLATATKV
jgi:ribulose-phosphate 3-epimerase